MGIPQLSKIASKRNIRLTFFVNCGQAIHIGQSLKTVLRRLDTEMHRNVTSLSSLRKFGLREYIRCALLNPVIINYAKEEIIQAYREGHEIGLHGGRNHELWGRLAPQWSDNDIRDEIHWGLNQLHSLGITPTSFASPCAVGGKRVARILKEFPNFKYLSDDLNPLSLRPQPSPQGLLDLPTALCGEGGVAYIEHLIAQGKSENEIVEHFKGRIQNMNQVIFYDHPYFAGDEGLPVFERLVDCALENGFEVNTLTEIGKYYEDSLSC